MILGIEAIAHELKWIPPVQVDSEHYVYFIEGSFPEGFRWHQCSADFLDGACGRTCVKIGHSKSLKPRLGSLSASFGNHIDLRLRLAIKVKNKFEACSLEQHLHGRFGELWINSEWFTLGPGLESFLSIANLGVK